MTTKRKKAYTPYEVTLLLKIPATSRTDANKRADTIATLIRSNIDQVDKVEVEGVWESSYDDEDF